MSRSRIWCGKVHRSSTCTRSTGPTRRRRTSTDSTGCRTASSTWPPWRTAPELAPTGGLMLTYIVRRLLQAVLVVLGVSLIVFVMIRITPGDPVRAYLGETATAEQVTAYRHYLGLDEPLPVQYLRFLQRAAVGDLGNSLTYHQPAA